MDDQTGCVRKRQIKKLLRKNFNSFFIFLRTENGAVWRRSLFFSLYTLFYSVTTDFLLRIKLITALQVSVTEKIAKNAVMK